jgi:Protein of unknown function (DUF2939)
MRKALVALVILAAVWISYAVSPIVGLYRLVNAVQARDSKALAERIVVDELRLSITQQVLRSYLRLTGRDKMNPFTKNVFVAATTSIADPIVARFVSPDAIVELLRDGWPKSVLPDQPAAGQRPAGFSGITTADLGSAWKLFVNSEYGFGSFRISLPPDAAPDRQFGLRLRLSQWTWKLAGIDLPQAIQDKLAQEIIKTNP